MSKVKTIDLLNKGKLVPPSPDKCQKCAVKHSANTPHKGDSLYYQYWFKKKYGRWPTWKDAMEHCTTEVKKLCIEVLEDHRVDWRNTV